MRLSRRAFKPTRILLLLRERKATTWAQLCHEFGLEPDRFHTGHTMLRMTLSELRDAQLVQFEEAERDRWRSEGIAGEIKVTPGWERIQLALDISLAQLAEMDDDHDLVVKPFWGRPDAKGGSHDAFVLMPFLPELRPVYEDHIRRVAASLELGVGRADDLFTARSVMADVWAAIFGARLVIADCTGRNPNVFYEMGLAHVLGKPVILITQDPDDVPFDVRHIRYIHYTFTPRGMADFEKSLERTIREELGL
jgi:hypothetical protein